MTAAIKICRVEDGDPLRFDVLVSDGNGATRHEVTITQSTFEKLAAGRFTPERCVEAAFLFLLDREAKESILGRFDISVIANYFPEFPRELSRYLASP
jgi:hypothetical protein